MKEGILAGAESRALVKNLELPTLGHGEKIYKTPMGEVKIGSEVLEMMSLEYIRLKSRENLLTSQQQSFCIHMRQEIRNLIGSTGRLSGSYFSTEIKLLSDHIESHWLQDLEKYGESLARDSQTEFLNQRALKREEALKYSKTFEQKTRGILQNEHRSKVVNRSPKLRKVRNETEDRKSRVNAEFLENKY